MDSHTIVPFSKKSWSAIVFEKLKQMIEDGFWKPEEKIFSEAELCEKFNVSRSTIREALNMLKAGHMIYTVPGLGSFVNKVADFDPAFIKSYVPDPKSEQDLLNVTELRLSIEPRNAYFAAQRATPEDLAKFKDCLDALMLSSDVSLFAESDLAFHMAVAEATKNPLVIDAMTRVKAFLLGQQNASAATPGRRGRAAQFHSQVLAAIGRRDPEGAEAAMREHLEDSYFHVQSLVTTSQRQSGRWKTRVAGGERATREG